MEAEIILIGCHSETEGVKTVSCAFVMFLCATTYTNHQSIQEWEKGKDGVWVLGGGEAGMRDCAIRSLIAIQQSKLGIKRRYGCYTLAAPSARKGIHLLSK